MRYRNQTQFKFELPQPKLFGVLVRHTICGQRSSIGVRIVFGLKEPGYILSQLLQRVKKTIAVQFQLAVTRTPERSGHTARIHIKESGCILIRPLLKEQEATGGQFDLQRLLQIIRFAHKHVM